MVAKALDSSTSAHWQLDSYEGGDMVAVDTGRLSCSADGSGVYSIDGGESKLSATSEFSPGGSAEETMPADIQAAGGTATDEELFSAEGDESWEIDSGETPTDYRIDETIARQVNCSHITAALAEAELEYDGTGEAAGVPADRWRGEATVSTLAEHAKGFAAQDYGQLTDMDLGKARLEIELWIDAENRPVVYYQHLSPQQSGLQDRWFAMTLTEWDEAEEVTAP
ncbi:hypothetical protein [Nocardiopsis suaedae]|uniref:Uncharacterized protein n=1 Tax=Nocardiopsis suaedae TaxID=3018444 RepID=A0ABT4TRE6_9ACTN|nr:hypothetical protein [Nocardiopsis suaedae]MDA2807279.1 hypothetical protein [Nocardiopsis suaedae]